MNTREREVMDALANELRSARDSVCGELTHERAAFKGFEGSSNIAQLEAELASIDSAIAGYEWIVAEGSASSEGAAVAWLRTDAGKAYMELCRAQAEQGEPPKDREADRARYPDAAFNRWLDDGISDAGHTVYDSLGSVFDAWHGWQAREDYGPKAAQGEQCSALEVFRIAGGDVECTPNPTAAVAMDCLRDLRECYDEALSEANRRESRRSCEGSELSVLERYSIEWRGPHMPIALPMPDGYWTPWHIAEEALKQRTSERRPIADEVLELSNSLEEDAALLRGLIDDGVPPADDLDRIADSMERASAFLKSALPRGLPAGSDALVTDAVRGPPAWSGILHMLMRRGWLAALSNACHQLKNGEHAQTALKLGELHSFLVATDFPTFDAKAPFALPVEVDSMESHENYKAYSLKDANGRSICDTLNSDLIEVHDEIDDDGAYSWDEVGRRNMEYIAATLNRVATAEQPSCGQNARDAAVRELIEAAQPISNYQWPNEKEWNRFHAAVAAIAAQQRQGGA